MANKEHSDLQPHSAKRPGAMRWVAWGAWKAVFHSIRPLTLLITAIITSATGLLLFRYLDDAANWVPSVRKTQAAIQAALGADVPEGVAPYDHWVAEVDMALNPEGPRADLDLARAYLAAGVDMVGADDFAARLEPLGLLPEVGPEAGSVIRVEAALEGLRNAGTDPAELVLLPKNLQDRYRSETAVFTQATRGAFDFATGAATGQVNADRWPTLAGAIASDVVLFGDVRDLIVHGCAKAREADSAPSACDLPILPKPDYDPFVFTLSGVGVALTGLTVATGGGGVVADAAAALFKSAAKAGKLTGRFGAYLVRTASEAVDVNRLASDAARAAGNWRGFVTNPARYIGDIRSAASASVDVSRTAELADVFSDVSKVAHATRPATAIRMLDIVETPTDLKKLAEVSETAGERTLVLHKILGVRMLKLAKSGLKITRKFVTYLLAFIAAAAGFLLSLLAFAGRRLVLGTLRASKLPQKVNAGVSRRILGQPKSNIS